MEGESSRRECDSDLFIDWVVLGKKRGLSWLVGGGWGLLSSGLRATSSREMIENLGQEAVGDWKNAASVIRFPEGLKF